MVCVGCGSPWFGVHGYEGYRCRVVVSSHTTHATATPPEGDPRADRLSKVEIAFRSLAHEMVEHSGDPKDRYGHSYARLILDVVGEDR